MATKLIKLQEDILVEVEVPEEEAKKISNRLADKVTSTVYAIKPVLITLCGPITEAWKDINQNFGMQIEQAEVEIGFGFEAEGNIYITKAKTDSNLKIKLTLKPEKKQHGLD